MSLFRLSILIVLLAAPVLAETRLIGTVTHVRDGDTIEVEGVPVRLDGLHCPENGEAGGAQLTAAMRQVLVSEPVSCMMTGERTYDRFVGVCERRGEDIGAASIEGGYCTRCARYDEEGRYAGLSPPRWRGSVPDYCRPR